MMRTSQPPHECDSGKRHHRRGDAASGSARWPVLIEALRSVTTLVTGGAGYIGSHMVHALTDAGERVVVLDKIARKPIYSMCLLRQRHEGLTPAQPVGDIWLGCTAGDGGFCGQLLAGAGHVRTSDGGGMRSLDDLRPQGRG